MQEIVKWGLFNKRYNSLSTELVHNFCTTSGAGAEVSFLTLLDGSVAGILALESPQHPRLRHKKFLAFYRSNALRQRHWLALMAFCVTYPFDWLAARKIELEVFSDSEAAIALFKKFGFKEENFKRASALRKGKYVNVLLMGLHAPY